MSKIGFIGTGVMGKSIIRNMMKTIYLSMFTIEQKVKQMI